MKNYIFGHTSEATALEVKDYPYGFRLRTSIFYWIESVPKKGDRFCSYTINPKNGRKNAPKKSTFSLIAVMFTDEKGHVKFEGVNLYTDREKVNAWVLSLGEEKLNDCQKLMLRQIRGEVLKKADPITGDALKNFAVKWESGTHVRLTFDRPDGVKLREVFEALKTLDKNRLKICFDNDGSAQICVRGGRLLGSVGAEAWAEYLASDENQVNEETEELEENEKFF